MNLMQTKNSEFVKTDWVQEQLQRMKEGNWERVDFQRFIHCIGCGRKKITIPIIKFFGFDVTKVKCYECQDTNK